MELARQTGATIVYGPTAKPAFPARVAEDGEEIEVGDVVFKVLHTPGHTMESTCYLLRNEEGKDVALFTGDTLFIGDVGRLDLAQKVEAELTPEVLAGHLYESLRNKILPLADDIVIYPAHGAGSACGKMMSKETTDTLGHQKKTNYALQPHLGKDEFIKSLLSGLTPPPAYFPANVLLNIQGSESVTNVVKRGTTPLSMEAFEAATAEAGALLLDTRDPQVFAQGFIPGSINIGINGSFAPWVGTLIPNIKQPILLIADEGREEEVVTRLARVGYDGAIGYLKGGLAAWKAAGKPTDCIPSITAEELAERQRKGSIRLLDVRRKSEDDSEHAVDAENAPLDYINDSMLKINPKQITYVHCASGYRSVVFASILKARGYHNLVDVKGGYKAIKASGRFRTTQYVQPTTEL